MEEQGDAAGRPQRAFGALSLEEEKHLLLAKAHLVIASWCRWSEEGKEVGGPLYRSSELLEQELSRELAVASQEIRSDKETMLSLLAADDQLLQHCSWELRNDPDVVLAACETDGYAMEHATPEIQANKKVVLEAVQIDGFALVGASAQLQDDPEVVMAAIESQPLAFQFASPSLREDRTLLLAALSFQTKENAQQFTEKVLQVTNPEFRSDKEVVLTACKVDGAAFTDANADLKKDKDFLLQVLRTAPMEDRQQCYELADDAIHRSLSFEEFLGAASSGLAIAGEAAPVLNVALLPEPRGHAEGSNQRSANISGFEVTLLSGASFSCKLPTASADAPTSSRDNGPELAEHEPPQKRPRLADSGSERAGTSTSSRACWTVSDLVKVVLAELPRHTQVEPPPSAVFIVFTNSRCDSEGVPVTPWDWKRSLTEFL